MPRAVIAVIAALAVSACSLGVAKPPATYRTGIVPDCEPSYVPPVIDYVAAAGALGTIALDDEVFCASCPMPYLIAAVFLATGVFGHQRVRACRAREAEHDLFLSLPKEEQDARIEARKRAEQSQR